MAKHNIETLKELVDAQFTAIRTELNLREEALILRTKEIDRRLEDLNGAHGREREQRAEFISREQFESQIKSLADGIANAERIARDAVPRNEWQSGKDFVATALSLAEGKSKGIGMSVGTLVTVGSIVSAVVVVANFLTR